MTSMKSNLMIIFFLSLIIFTVAHAEVNTALTPMSDTPVDTSTNLADVVLTSATVVSSKTYTCSAPLISCFHLRSVIENYSYKNADWNSFRNAKGIYKSVVDTLFDRSSTPNHSVTEFNDITREGYQDIDGVRKKWVVPFGPPDSLSLSGIGGGTRVEIWNGQPVLPLQS